MNLLILTCFHAKVKNELRSRWKIHFLGWYASSTNLWRCNDLVHADKLIFMSNQYVSKHIVIFRIFIFDNQSIFRFNIKNHLSVLSQFEISPINSTMRWEASVISQIISITSIKSSLMYIKKWTHLEINSR